MAQFFLWVLKATHIFWINTQIDVPIPALIQPVVMPLFVGSWLNKEFHFHLLEFTRPENEVTRGNFIAETLSGLTDSKWWLFARRIHHIQVVHKDSLCCFWSQVVNGACIFDGTNGGSQHAIEIARLGELTLGSTVCAIDDCQSFCRFLAVVLLGIGLQELISAVALVAVLTFCEWVNECIHVPGCLPDLGGQNHRGVQADDVIALTNDGLPPLPAHVFLELDTVGAVIPR